MASMFATTLVWERTTPLGAFVLPDVYWMRAVSEAGVSSHIPGADRRRCAAVVTARESWDARSEKACQGKRLLHRHESRNARVEQNGGLPLGVLTQPIEAQWRVEGYRHATCEAYSHEGREEVQPRGKDQGHALSPREASGFETACYGTGRVPKLAVSEGGLEAPRSAQEDVGPRRLGSGTEGESRSERPDVGGQAEVRRWSRSRSVVRCQARRRGGGSSDECSCEVGRRVEPQVALVQLPSGGVLEAKQQLHALETPEPNLAFEGRVGCDGVAGSASPRLFGEPPYDLEDAIEPALRLHRGTLAGVTGRRNAGRTCLAAVPAPAVSSPVCRRRARREIQTRGEVAGEKGRGANAKWRSRLF